MGEGKGEREGIFCVKEVSPEQGPGPLLEHDSGFLLAPELEFGLQ